MFFRFGQDRSKSAYGTTSHGGGGMGHTVTAGFGGYPSGQGNNASAGGQYDVSRYNPVHDHLEIGSLIEDWIPRDASGMNQMWRLIYLRDAIVGPAIDLYSNLPYSECRLTGIDDPAILKIYEDTLTRLNISTMMPELVREFLMIGKFCCSLIFDQREGVFTDITAHDPDFLRIEPIPVRGFDPKIDLVASPGLKNFLHSTDERDIAVRDALPPQFFETFEQHGTYKLNPLNTIFVPRRSTPYDQIGTSFLTRIVNFWALEKSLIESTVTNARRRTRSILHIKAGLDNVWEPTEEELEAISGLFIQADEDPVGAVVTTRTGVETDEVRSGIDFWKLSDEWSFLTEGKMRALGISDAFLSGDASYNNMETSLSIFMETLRSLRTYMDRRIFYEKIFATLARVHGFVKKEARGRGPSRMHYQLNYKKALQIPVDDLLMPKIVWEKKLQPEGDQGYIDMLKSVEEAGVPITMKQWAQAAGLNIEETMEELQSDTKIRKQIAGWRKQFTGDQAMEQEVLSSTSLKAIPVWDESNRFVTLSADEALDILDHFFESRGNMAELADKDSAMRTISGMVDGNSLKTELMAYLLKRLGVCSKWDIPEKTVSVISEHLQRLGTDPDSSYTKKNIIQEFQVLARLTAKDLPAERKKALIGGMSKQQDMSPFNPKTSVTGVW